MESEDDNVLDTSKIRFYGDFDQQVCEVMDFVCLKKEEMIGFKSMLIDLKIVLSPVCGDNNQFLVFGSIFTGLGIRTSDIDCCMQLPHRLGPPDTSFLIKVKNILMRHQHLFQNVFAIVNAKVPIVQFYHVPTQMWCDLCFNNQGGLANSNLIAYILKTDKKVLQLTILIKYWSKVHNLTGTNLMSSYSLTLLVIFFLQQINILYSVEDLQKNVEENYLNGWNIAFSPLELSNRKNKTIYELLGDFFKYYKTFEFDKYIVSPYLGRPILRELFAKVETVPLNFSQYKTNIRTKNFKPLRLDTVMCIQDPFEHNQNCAVAVYAKLGQRIHAQIQTAICIYGKEDSKTFLKAFLQTSPVKSPPEKKNRLPLTGVRKNYRSNQNLRKFEPNFRQNFYHRGNWRGRNRGNWRGRNGGYWRRGR